MSNQHDDLLIKTQAQLVQMQSATINAQSAAIVGLRERVNQDAATIAALRKEVEKLREQLGMRGKGMQA